MTSVIENILLADKIIPHCITQVMRKRGDTIYQIQNTQQHFELFAKSDNSWVLFDIQKGKLYEIDSFENGILLIKNKTA